MNKTIDKDKLTNTKYKFLPELDLKHPESAYSAFGAFTKHRGKIHNLEKQQIQKLYIERNKKKLVLLMLEYIFLKILT